MSKFEHVKMPTLEEAKEITRKFKRPIGHRCMLINCVAPSRTKNGLTISDAMQKQHQSEINAQGMLVVSSIHNEHDIAPAGDVQRFFEGEKVVYGINTQANLLTTVRSNELIEGLELKEGAEPTPEMYRQYVIMIIDNHNIVAVVE